MSDPPAHVRVVPDESNLSHWDVTIEGPVSCLQYHLTQSLSVCGICQLTK